MLSLGKYYQHTVPFLRRYTGGMGLRIKKIRKERGLTQVELADMAGISRPHLTQIENETTPANTVRLTAIARALGVQVHELFDDATEAPIKDDILALMAAMSTEDRETLLRMARALVGSGQQQG